MRSIPWTTAIFAVIIVSSAIPVFAASQSVCKNYADTAVHYFEIGTNSANARKCRIQPDARWQPNFKNHFEWCLRAPLDWVRSEGKARTDRLLACGAISNY
jgi:hypothetical protein